MRYLVLIIVFLFSSVQAESLIEKNYDINISCKLEKSCVAETNNCKYFDNTVSLHFSLDTKINSYLEFRTCTKDDNVNRCYERYAMGRYDDGIWICEGGGCSKGVITRILPHEISAVDSLGLFEVSTDWDGTFLLNGKKLPSYSYVEYIIDRTRGTMIENWIDGCYGSGSCSGAWLNHGQRLPLHEKITIRYYSCQKMEKKLF